MSNPLTDARAALAEALKEEGFRVVSEVPQTFSPPLCWVEPRGPYCQPGQTFARKKVSLAVICLAAAGTNSAALASTEDMAWNVRAAIEAMDSFRLDPDEEIGAPGLYSSATQGQQYVGAPVNVIADVVRGGS